MNKLREELGLPVIEEKSLDKIQFEQKNTINNEHHKHVHVPFRIEGDNMLFEWSLDYNGGGTKLNKAKPLKDQPVRESGLGIW
jgi:hypothetical protein